MKTPDEIKNDAETCLNHPLHAVCNVCRLYDECDGIAEHIIKELYDLVIHYESRLTQAERERDALMKDVKEVGCGLCKHIADNSEYSPCNGCYGAFDQETMTVSRSNWQWRGICKENTKEEPK